MAKQVRSYRISDDVHEAVAAYAKARGASAGVVVESACREFLKLAEGGVPELPVTDTAEVRRKRAESIPGVRRARVLAPADPLALARQAKLNKARGDAA